MQHRFPLLATTIMIMAIGIFIPYTYIGGKFRLVPLPGEFYYWLAGTLLSYCLLTQAIKMWFIRKFHYWL